MKYYFIDNPVAGTAKNHMLVEKIKDVLITRDDCNFIATTKPGHATVIAKKIAEQEGENATIIVCGGDGTLGEVTNGIIGTKTALALLPMGTGNDFARKIYGNISLEEIISRFGFLDGKFNMEAFDIDCIEVNGDFSINVTSMGLDTKIVKIANKLSKKFPTLGPKAYRLAIVLALFGELNSKLSLTLDVINESGKIETISFKEESALAAICNGSYYGGGFCPAKESKLDDGVLNLTMAKKLNLISIARIIGSYSKGDAHIKHPKEVLTFKVVGGRVSLQDGSPLDYNCDGNVSNATAFNFKVHPKMIRLACFENEALKIALE